jgi:hypothetical protein
MPADTEDSEEKVAEEANGELIELPSEPSEPCWDRTSDPLLKRPPRRDDEAGNPNGRAPISRTTATENPSRSARASWARRSSNGNPNRGR